MTSSLCPYGRGYTAALHLLYTGTSGIVGDPRCLGYTSKTQTNARPGGVAWRTCPSKGRASTLTPPCAL